jgi:hypothetical protein
MTVPETSMDEYRLPQPWKDDVRTPRQVPPMQSESIAKRMRDPANRNLWRRVPLPYSRHPASRLFKNLAFATHARNRLAVEEASFASAALQVEETNV